MRECILAKVPSNQDYVLKASKLLLDAYQDFGWLGIALDADGCSVWFVEIPETKIDSVSHVIISSSFLQVIDDDVSLLVLNLLITMKKLWDYVIATNNNIAVIRRYLLS